MGAGAFFALASAKKKERESAKKKEHKKAKAPSAKEKGTNSKGEMEGKRQRDGTEGRDREEGTDRRVSKREETGEKRHRWSDRGEETEAERQREEI